MDPASVPKEVKLIIEVAAIEGKVNGLVEPLEKLGHRTDFSQGMMKAL